LNNKNDCDDINGSPEEGNKMPVIAKTEEAYKGLSLSSKKIKDITVKPKVKNGKVLLDKKNKDHRYIVEEEC